MKIEIDTETIYEQLLYIVLIILGIASIVWGFTNKHNEIFQGIGGALIGTGFSGLLTTFRKIDSLHKIRELLNNGLNRQHDLLCNSLYDETKSDEALLKHYIGIPLYSYHITRTSKYPKGIWGFATITFKYKTPARLIAIYDFVDAEGDKAEYVCEAEVKGKRLLLSLKAKTGEEAPDVIIYPNGGAFYGGYEWYGISIGESFTGADTLRARILSKRKLIAHDEPGFITDVELQKVLTAKWQRGFSARIDIPITDGNDLELYKDPEY